MTTKTEKIPATIITGFLGSGKTTLLRHILSNNRGLRIAVIINEFGELGIDREILKGCDIGCEAQESAGTLYELANGCLCCTVQDEFFPVMQQLAERRDQIDLLVIETSGLALPKPLVQAFNWPEIKNVFTIDAVVTVVDAPATAEGQFAENPQAVDAQRRADPNLDHESPLHELFADQLSAADLVVLTKTDLIDATQRELVETLVREEIPASVKITSATHGVIDLAILLGLNSASEDSIHLRTSHHDLEGEEDHDHDAFDSIAIELPVVDKEKLIATLNELVEMYPIYRIKGFVALADKQRRLVIHGVGCRFDGYFDRPWRDEETPSTRIVLIGQELDHAVLKDALRKTAIIETA